MKTKSIAEKRIYSCAPLRLAVLAIAGGLALLPPAAVAQCAGVCKANEVLVHQSDTHCYCQDRHLYAQCIQRAGRRFHEARKKDCSLAVGKCFNEKNASITEPMSLCLVSCVDPKEILQPQGEVPACLKNCGVAEIVVAYHVSSRCIFAAVNDCQARALAQQRKDTEACKHD
jgi:hypothetical protein